MHNDQLLNVLVEAQQIANDTTALLIVQSSEPRPSTVRCDKGSDPKKPIRNWKKPKDMPKRPLSAYNFFFKSERLRMLSLATNDNEPPRRNKKGKALGIGFASMARSIGSKWKKTTSSDKSVFEEQARIEKARYHKEITVWRFLKEAAKEGPTKKKTDPPRKEAPIKASISITTAVGLDDPTPFDASDMPMYSPHKLMQGTKDDTLLLTRGHKESYKLKAVAGIDTAPLLSRLQLGILSDGCQQGSIAHAFDFRADHPLEEVKQPSSLRIESPSNKESGVAFRTYEPVPDSCWEALECTLRSAEPFISADSSNGKSVQEKGVVADELSLFMDIMESTADW